MGKKKEAKVGDVWESETSGRRVRITSVCSLGWLNYVTCAGSVDGTASTRGFLARRRLVERDGKPVDSTTTSEASAPAMPAKLVPQAGDIWKSKGGKLHVKVDSIDTRATPVVRWTGVYRRESGVCSVANFGRGRKLVERDGKPVKEG